MTEIFKKMRGCTLSYDKQGYIYFLCRNYSCLPQRTKEKIKRLCDEVAGEYSPALFRVLTSSAGIRRIAEENYISERLLYDLRREFYERFF